MKKNTKVFLSSVLFFAVTAFSGFSQITTANEFFKAVSDYYASFKDYQATVSMKIDKQEMSASLLYMAPNKMRLDFSMPAEQTIVFDGSKLICYIPESGSILVQDANASASPDGASMVTSEGLALLRRAYSISYLSGQDPVDLDETDSTKVIKLVLKRRNGSESFREITVSVDPSTKLIRRMVGVTPGGVVYKFDFTNYEINQGITEKRFKYDIPSGANAYNNFLIGE